MPRRTSAEVINAARRTLTGARLGRSSVHLVTLGLAALTVWMLVNFVGQVITSAQLERRKTELSAEIAAMEAANQALRDRVGYAESPAYAEQIAREQLGYAREGDMVILPTFPDLPPAAVVTAPVPLPKLAPQPNWRAWLFALFPPR